MASLSVVNRVNGLVAFDQLMDAANQALLKEDQNVYTVIALQKRIAKAAAEILDQGNETAPNNESEDLTPHEALGVAVTCLHKYSRAIEKAKLNNQNYYRDLTLSYLCLARLLFARKGYEQQYQKLLNAIVANDTSSIKKLLESGVHADCAIGTWPRKGDFIHTGTSVITALSAACIRGKPDIVQQLLSFDADPNFMVLFSSHSEAYDFEQEEEPSIENPYIIPSWLALLVSNQPDETKEQVWDVIKAKVDPMQPERGGYWLSRAFCSTQFTPANLHMVLKNIKDFSVKHKRFLEISLENVVQKYSKRRGNSLNSITGYDELKDNTIKLAAVAIFHGAFTPKLFERSREPHSWESHMVIFNSKLLHLKSAAGIRKDIETRLKEEVGYIEDSEDTSDVMNYMKILNVINRIEGLQKIKPLLRIVEDYYRINPQEFNAWVAQKCFDSVFKTK